MTSSRALRRLHLSLAVSLTTLALSSGLLAWALRQEARAALPAHPTATAAPAPTAPVAVAVPPPPAVALTRTAPPLRIVLLRSTATAQHTAMLAGTDASAYDRVIDDWDAWLRTRGHAVDRLDETALADLVDVDGRTVIIAPSTAALGDKPLAALTAAVQRGTGLVASSQLALFAGENRYRGDQALRTLAGIRPLPELHAAALGTLEWIAVLGGGPLGAGLPAGARLELTATDRPLLVESDGAAADFVHWDLLPLGSPDAPIRPTAVAARQVGRGRVVWINFEPGAVRSAGTGAAWLDRLRENALAWSAGQPVADLETWPGGVRMAAVLALDAADRLEQADAVARRFRDAGVPLTAFVDPAQAQGHAADVTLLASAGEVAAWVSDAAPIGGVPRPPPALDRARAALETLAHAPIFGLRPPDERTDQEVIAGGAAAGFAYLAGAPEADRAEPWLARSTNRALVVLPRIPRGGDELDGSGAGDDPAKAWAAIRGDLLQVRRLGGFYLFDFAAGRGSEPAVDAGVARLLGLRAMPEVWLTTAREAAAWWRARAGVALRVEVGNHVMTITVTAAAPADRLGIVLHLPAGTDELRLDVEAGPVPLLERVGDTDARLEYRTLTAGETARTRIVLR